MNKPNAVKFNVVVTKSELKRILIESFDLGVNINYPNIKKEEDHVKIKGVCLIDNFEQLVTVITPLDLSFLDRLSFQRVLNFKLIEIDIEPVNLPTGAEKEVKETKVEK